MTNFDDRGPGQSDPGRREGKAAPPSQILAAPASRLGTDPHPRDVTHALDTLVNALDAVIGEVKEPGSHGIHREAPPHERAGALADALVNGELKLAETSERDGARESEESQRAIQQAVEDTRHDAAVESDASAELLDALATPEAAAPSQTLVRTVGILDEHAKLTAGLETVSVDEQAGRELVTTFGNSTAAGARTLAGVGEKMQELRSSLERCRREHDEFEEVSTRLRTAAAEQTEKTFASQGEPRDAVAELANELEEEHLLLIEEASSVSRAAANLVAADAAESKAAQNFLGALRNSERASEEDVRDALADAVEALDTSATVRTRLEGVDPESLTRTADRLLEELDEQPHPVTTHLAERVAEIKGTIDRSNEADLLTVYAGRQELRYYDRKLLPELSSPSETDTQAQQLVDELDGLEQRWKEMRQSYPTEYPDCDHTIPIYFFDLVSEQLESARSAHGHGDIQRASGLLTAAETTLDWIEGLYETHSYFVLLKELRGQS